MAERVCPKCGAPVKAERSAVRLSLRCTACSWAVVKRIVEKGYG